MKQRKKKDAQGQRKHLDPFKPLPKARRLKRGFSVKCPILIQVDKKKKGEKRNGHCLNLDLTSSMGSLRPGRGSGVCVSLVVQVWWS